MTEINLASVGTQQSMSRRPTSWRSNVTLDVTCQSPQRAFVRAPLLDSEWAGKLNIQGSAAAPQMKGKFDVRRGHLVFLDRRHSLDGGTVSFDGAYPPDPYVSINASAQTREALVKLTLYGKTTDIQIELSSEPPLPRDEVLSRLLFDRNLAQITPLQAVQLARTANMLTGGWTGEGLLTGWQHFFGIDRFEIRQQEETGEYAVGVGKYLSDNESGKASVRVELTPRITIETELGADATHGLGLLWKKEY